MGSNFLSHAKVCIRGIKWSEGNKDWFLHLDKKQCVSWYGCLFRGKLGEGYVMYKTATSKQLLSIIQGLLHSRGNYSHGEIWI